jgi:DUF4097 and DUF4098 domain-containing protein YvlB
MKDLEKELRSKNLKQEEIDEILADHEEMIQSAINEGLTDDEIIEKFGNPKDIAEEISEFTDKEEADFSDNEKTLEFDNVQEGYNVEVSLINEDIHFQTNTESKILVTYKGKKSLRDYIITFENNTFKLSRPKVNSIFTSFRREQQMKFIISLPNNIDLGKYKAKNINGDFELSDLTIKEFILDTNNGDGVLSNLKLSSMSVNTINGDLKIEKVSCETFNTSMISGDIKAEEFNCEGDVYVNTVSGDFDIKNSKWGETTLKTVSGDLKGKEFYPKTLSLTTVSGDILIKNSEKRPIEVKKNKSISGDVKIIINSFDK